MKLLCFICVSVFISNTMALDMCTDVDKVKIAKCYNHHVFAALPRKGFKDHFLAAIRNQTNLPAICEGKKILDECLGGPLIQRCLNVVDFKNVTFVESDVGARTFVAIYLQIDYGCGKVPHLLRDQHTCIFTQGNQCKMDFHNCSTADAFSSCAIDRVTKHCGKPAGCFVQKFTALQKCYVQETCVGCDVLRINNKAIDHFCHDDLNSGIRYPTNIVIIITTILSYVFYFH